MKTVIVVPAYNEASRIGAVIPRLRAYGDVVVVDDGSRDGTADIARAAGAFVFAHAVNRGQGAALRTGTEAALRAGADAIVHVDADGQQDPDAVPRLLAPLAAGEADVVYGSRFMEEKPEGMPASRRALLWGGRQFSVYALGIPPQFTDPQSGMRAMTAAAARQLEFHQDRMAHCSELLRLVAKSGLRWKEVPVKVRYTAETMAKGQYRGGVASIVWSLFLGEFKK